MSLTQALNTALAGLTVTQTSLGLVAANVANAKTPGYVVKTPNQIATTAGDAGSSVRIDSINRQLDTFVQQQLRTETSGGAYADLRASFYQQLQQVYGQPGSTTSFDALYNGFTAAVQALATSPDSTSAQTNVLSTAQALAGQLNNMGAAIQGLRSQADQGIATDVQLANQAIDVIASTNRQLGANPANDATAAALEDQRDQSIMQLAKFLDLRVVPGEHNQVTVFTGSGYQLVGTEASHLTFSPAGTVTAGQQWSADPSKRTLGTVGLTSASGTGIDLVANGGIRSGEIAGYLQMRDQTLVQAQTQIDEFAAQMSRSLSDRATAGTAVAAGSQSGFEVDVGAVAPGNTLQLTYTDTATGTQQQVTIVRVDDPAALPLSATLAADYPGKAIGINFAGGIGSVVAQLNVALGSQGVQFSNPSGTLLQVLNTNSGRRIDALAATSTATTLTGGSAQLPMFTDGGIPYTGIVGSAGAQRTGLAGRISVNNALIADPSRLVVFQTSPRTPAGDATRPSFILDQLTNAQYSYSRSTGVGGTSAPFHGTLTAFASQVVSQQSQAAVGAANLKQGQDMVVSALEQRFTDASGVNVDTEMARLLTLQSAYGANARVMTAIKQMLDTLLQM